MLGVLYTIIAAIFGVLLMTIDVSATTAGAVVMCMLFAGFGISLTLLAGVIADHLWVWED